MEKLSFGKKIRKLRKENNLTQKQLAEKLHISDNVISVWENDNRIPDITMIKQIADVFNVDFNSLVDSSINPKVKVKFKTRLLNILKYIKNNFLMIISRIIFVLLLIFFINNYNSVKLYMLKIDNQDLLIQKNYLLETSDRIILFIDNINILKINTEMNDINVKLYTKTNGEEEILYVGDDLNRIYIEEPINNLKRLRKENIKAIKKGLYLKVSFKDDKNKLKVYNIQFYFHKLFSNNKLIYKKYKENNEYNIKTNYSYIDEMILINKGYKKVENFKKYIKKENNIEYLFDLQSNIYSIKYKRNLGTYIFKYNYNENVYKVIISKKNNLYINFVVKNDKLFCYKGDCKEYKKYINYIKKEFLKFFK